MNKKILICFIALILLAATAHAACDYSAKEKITAECYDSAEFYQKSNPALWNFAQVKWDNPAIWSNPKIQNTLNTNENARNEYFKKTGCAGCTFVKITDIYCDAKKVPSCASANAAMANFLTFSSTGIKHQNGDFVTPKNYPEGTAIRADKNGITVFLTSKAKSINVPATDTLTINTALSNNPTLTGAGIPTGVIVKGSLSFKNGQAYVKGGASATINNVEIKTFTDTLIFFNGERQPLAENKDYISLNPSTRKMFINSKSEFGIASIDFQENNPFFKIEKKDELSIWGIKNAEISIRNRDSELLIPAVNIKAKNQDSSVEISSGMVNIILKGKTRLLGEPRLEADINYGNAGSSPMSITAQDENGKSLLGTDKNPQKIVIDNYNEFVTISEKEGEGLGKEGWKVSERLKMNYDPQTAVQGRAIILDKRPSDRELQRLIATSNGKVIIMGVTDPAMAREIYDSLLKMPTKLAGSVFAIDVTSSDKEFAKLLSGNPNSDTGATQAFAGPDGIVVFKGNEFFNQRNLFHESAHTRVFSLAQTNPEFSNAWNSAAGNVYGKGLALPLPGNTLPVAWADGSDGARNGCVRAYGCNELHEDVATFTEMAYTKPDNMKILVRGKDPRYLQKLDLCCSYGFMDGAQYKLITGNTKKCGEAG